MNKLGVLSMLWSASRSLIAVIISVVASLNLALLGVCLALIPEIYPQAEREGISLALYVGLFSAEIVVASFVGGYARFRRQLSALRSMEKMAYDKAIESHEASVSSHALLADDGLSRSLEKEVTSDFRIDPSSIETLQSEVDEGTQEAASLGVKREYVNVPIYYATNRSRTASDSVNDFYGSKRGILQYGQAFVTVPVEHDLGEIERPSLWRFEFRENPEKHIILDQIIEKEKDLFFREMSADVGVSRDKSVFVFIHGFNVSFAEGARRTAQMAYDLFLIDQEGAEAKLSTLPILYSWPSNGDVAKYTYDAANAEASANHFRAFLLDVCARSRAEAVTIIAHSMGNLTLANALRDIGLVMKEDDGPIVNEIILAAPDIDRDIFLGLAKSVAQVGRRITLYASSMDKALMLSKSINGFPRLGDASDGIVTFENGDSIDATAVGEDILAHSYYGRVSVLSDMHALMTQNANPGERFGLLQQGQPPDRYWVMRAR